MKILLRITILGLLLAGCSSKDEKKSVLKDFLTRKIS